MFHPSDLQKLFPSFVQLNPFADIPSDVHLPPIKIKALSQQIYLALKKNTAWDCTFQCTTSPAINDQHSTSQPTGHTTPSSPTEGTSKRSTLQPQVSRTSINASRACTSPALPCPRLLHHTSPRRHQDHGLCCSSPALPSLQLSPAQAASSERCFPCHLVS